jgi:hypothetical protein
VLGRHTLTVLADKSTFDEKQIAYNLTSFGDPEPALHIGRRMRRQSSNAPRNVPAARLHRPPQLQAFTDPNFKGQRLRAGAREVSVAAAARLFDSQAELEPRSGLHERQLRPRFARERQRGLRFRHVRAYEVPNKNYRLQQTKVTSFALNGQSFFGITCWS